MHAAVSILLAVIVTVHSVGGLCWQCADVPAGCSNSPAATTICNCHRSAEVPSGGETVRESDSSCEFECTGTCRYVQTVRLTVEQPADTLWIAELPPESSAIPGRSVFDIFERSALARGGHPPLRLHLFLGLLLI